MSNLKEDNDQAKAALMLIADAQRALRVATNGVRNGELQGAIRYLRDAEQRAGMAMLAVYNLADE